jgi:hypothetical protein
LGKDRGDTDYLKGSVENGVQMLWILHRPELGFTQILVAQVEDLSQVFEGRDEVILSHAYLHFERALVHSIDKLPI